MRIVIAPHTLARAAERGASRAEIEDVIENGEAMPAKAGRQARFRIYPYGAQRLGKSYPEKRVEVVFVQEGEDVTTVTVYVFYGTWSGR